MWAELSNSDRGPAIEFARAMKQTHPNLPLAFNYSSSFRWHKDPNPLTFRELGELGYKFIFITLFGAHAAMYSVWNAMHELVKNEEQAQWALERTKVGHPTESHHVMARVSHFQELERRYIPGTEDRLKGSDGFGEANRPLGAGGRSGAAAARGPDGAPEQERGRRSERRSRAPTCSMLPTTRRSGLT